MPKQSAKRKPTLAAQADKYALYLRSVQAPDYDVEFFDRVFRREFGRRALVLREDFCGTAAVCAEWVRSRKDRRAYGVDIDPEPLAWGARNILSGLSDEQRGRVRLIEADVRSYGGTKADVLAAQNFSFNCFKTRDELRRYFRTARRHLAREGLMVLDVMGGSDSIEEDKEEVTAHKGFRYVWEQRRFDPITHDCEYAIHFRFRDGSELRQAFHYQWRLWTLPELRELLAEAGFSRSDVYWELTDSETGEGNGVYRKRDSAESDPAWIAYVVAVK